MLTISNNANIQTVITTFDVTPATCQDLFEELSSACQDVISKQPGYIASALHINDARTRIANYSQWESRDDFHAMLRIDEMRLRNQRINELCKNFAPVMYEVATCVS
ncbi:MAG: antibiotic biosynthesis monooxygenase [Rhodobacteraceae bacterium]|nr:antibiotic biosynthesis monooxygenase [Paracoccaceae bacterium]